MASVKVNRGAIAADDPLDHVSREEWHLLLGARRGFIRTHLPYDCRMLVRFVQDAEKMASPLGFEGVEDFLRRGLEIDPELVEWALRGLAKLSPDEQVGPVPLNDAVEAGRQLVERTEPAASHGREGASSAEEHRAVNGNTYPDRGKDTYGNSSRHIVSRLKRDAEGDERAAELLEAIRDGVKTPNAAAVEMGWRKKKPTVQLDEQPDRAAARLVERFGLDWCRDLVIALDAAVQREGGA